MSKQTVLNFVIFCCFVSAHLAQNDPPCGVKGPSQLSSGELGIIGGDDAGPFEFPWKGVLYRNRILLCGASILNSRWVITAGACMSKLFVGKHNWNELQNSKEYENVVRSLSFSDQRSTDGGFDKVIFHPNFAIGAYNIPVNDIALLKLKEALPLSDPSQHLAAICLPKEYTSDHYLEGTVCTITGFGMINQNGDLSQTLKRANVTISKHRSCMKTYADVATVDRTMICTYDEGKKGFCHGDGGGPMICYDEGKWNLIGIMSWQYGCAEPNYPEVYTRVVEFVQWINETIANN